MPTSAGPGRAEFKICQQAAKTGDGVAPDGQIVIWVA